ncbi:hypothetical protein YC2023_103038 [Brassica napus]
MQKKRGKIIIQLGLVAVHVSKRFKFMDSTFELGLSGSINQAPVVNMEDGQATESATNMGDAQKISLGVGEAKSARSCSRREQTQTPLCE